ncbi:hypothetical protein ROLI_037570 [Roseobacter fucihabitans]|uniref:DUF2125 domain-containing protein n=1 Tax=Roseobacter fucihabitans TaxID=1537242 RepID=A0ABZ2BXF1_9RHOB|nr:DUF2125 domain-containing protein [Roseobacter litoralis]MBC6967830.1 hypothetical protein [Roseobacter litoralis]
MSFLSFRSIASVTLALSMGHAAHADLTAQNVWSDWQSQFEGFGNDVSATETQSGDTLILNDLTISTPGSEEAAATRLQMGQVTFTENNDGTVSIALPDLMPFQMQIIGEDGKPADIEMEIRQSGLVSTVSGVPTQMTNSYTAQSMDIVLTDLTLDGEKLSSETARFNLGLTDLAGSTTSTVGGKRVMDQNMQASTVTYSLAFTDPEGGGDLQANGQMADISFEGSSQSPLSKVASGDISALLAAGMGGGGTFAYAAGASNMTVTENAAEVFSSTTTSTGGTLNVEFSPEGLAYSGDQNNLKLAMTSPDFPVPVDLDMVKSSFNLAVPVQKSEAAEDFALGFSLNDFSVSDTLWGLFDPSAQLPRNPATIALDLTGKARVLANIFDPALEEFEGPPAALETLDIKKLQITIAGAELTGEGAFRFDNNTPDAMPQPVGIADLSLVGGNKLIDTLVAMGLLPEDQAMGARMMMGLLAAPGAQPDTLNSRIEINAQGHVLANGQRIQ